MRVLSSDRGQSVALSHMIKVEKRSTDKYPLLSCICLTYPLPHPLTYPSSPDSSFPADPLLFLISR